MPSSSQYRLQRVADLAAAQKSDPARHKCFISYHAEDTDEVAQFIDDFGSEFIAKTIGVSDEDDFIDSEDTAYVMDQIRTKYLGDSSVTIVMIGASTWARRYVDWEIYSSLRSSKHSKVNGLLAVTLPSISGVSKQLPARLGDNISGEAGYARWKKYPTTKSQIRSYIDDAFDARSTKTGLIVNNRDRKQRNSSC